VVGYAKLFGSLIASSLMDEAQPTPWLFVVMLAMADRDGIVEASVPGLAHLARVPIADVQKALAVLAAPDPHSRTPTQDGRRIESVPGGWRLVNYELYRDRLSPDQKREQARLRQQRKRSRDASRDVTHGHAPSRSVTPSEAEAEAVGTRAPRVDLPGFPEFWEAFGHRVARPAAERAWRRVAPDAELAALIASRAAAYAAATPDKAFRKHPATWLRNACWNDELPAQPAAGSASHIPNMPLGHASCRCQGCVAHRGRRRA
jgi:hypothetical protein